MTNYIIHDQHSNEVGGHDSKEVAVDLVKQMISADIITNDNPYKYSYIVLDAIGNPVFRATSQIEYLTK